MISILKTLCLFGITFAFLVFENKIKINKVVKTFVLGIVFAGMALLSYIFKIPLKEEYYCYTGNSVIILAGFFFGGFVGGISGLISGISLIIASFLKADNITYLASGICLIISGAFILFLQKYVISKEKVQWFYPPITGLISECIYLLIALLTNIKNIDAAYLIIKHTSLATLLINGGILLVCSVIYSLICKLPLFKLEKPTSIQTKVQGRLALVVLIAFSVVISLSSGVLNYLSEESTYTTLTTSLNDIEDNLDSDIDSQCRTSINNARNQLAQRGYLINQSEQILEDVATAQNVNVTDLSYINEDGTIVGSSNPIIKNMSNISELGIKPFDPRSGEVVITPYQYNSALNSYRKILISPTKVTNLNGYFFVCTVDESAYQNFLQISLQKGIGKRRINEKGCIAAFNPDKELVSVPEGFSTITELNTDNMNSVTNYTYNDIEYYGYLKQKAGYYFLGLMDKEECTLNKDISIAITTLSSVLIFFLLYLIIYLSTYYSVIKPLNNVNNSLEDICQGQLDEQVNEVSSKELKLLSEDINSTVLALKDYIGKEAKLIQKELGFARNIQRSALPHLSSVLGENNSFDIYASMDPAKEVGGDFYDFYFVDDSHLFILIADVSGKGVPAAMFMMQSKTIIKTLIENKIPVDKAMTLANTKLCETDDAQMFLTVWCGVLDLETGVLEYVNAGHNAPLLKTGSQTFEYLKGKPGFVLAGLDGFKYESQRIQLNKNDELFLYTDGVTEAYSVNEEQYGEARLLKAVNERKNNTSKEFCERILENVKGFAINKDQSDDITMLHIKYFGK